MEDYNQGKPLTARRIVMVKEAIDRLVGDFSAKVTAAKAAAKAEAILANLAELKQAANGDPAILAAGKIFLAQLEGKSVPDGLITARGLRRGHRLRRLPRRPDLHQPHQRRPGRGRPLPRRIPQARRAGRLRGGGRPPQGLRPPHRPRILRAQGPHRQRRPPVVTLSDQDADTRTIALSFDEIGRLTMQFDGVQNLTVLQTGLGSTAESHLTLEINANELDRLASLDYTRFDDTAANEVMADKTATNKLPAAQKTFAPEDRFADNAINIHLGLQFSIK
ncbi:MAG: hypothetical protein IKQ55_00715 [Kiritimatiellae bacterium]|nr:hypothetical protein [Kiritimatiellia bacterium]